MQRALYAYETMTTVRYRQISRVSQSIKRHDEHEGGQRLLSVGDHAVGGRGERNFRPAKYIAQLCTRVKLIV